jgi:hypothetical protein
MATHATRSCGVGGVIGPARVGSRLRGRKAHRVLMLLPQGFRNLWRQRRIRLFFDPCLLFGSRFHLRDLALQTAAQPAVGGQLINRIQLKGAARFVRLLGFGLAGNNERS